MEDTRNASLDILEKSNSESGKERLCRSEKKRRLREENNKWKKAVRREKKQERKKRLRKAEENQEQADEGRLSKKQLKLEREARCRSAMIDGQRIGVDLSVENHMTDKEKSKVAQQLCRLYGANRQSHCPFHIFFLGINKQGLLYQECVRKNQGFENYQVDMMESPVTEVFKAEEVVYLSPDASDPVTSLDKSKVYIIGGFVDESIKKNVTLSKCDSSGLCCKRLPIVEYMERQPGLVHYSTVLTLNQVFEILLRFSENGDWRAALSEGVPKRSGYRLKSQEPSVEARSSDDRQSQSDDRSSDDAQSEPGGRSSDDGQLAPGGSFTDGQSAPGGRSFEDEQSVPGGRSSDDGQVVPRGSSDDGQSTPGVTIFDDGQSVPGGKSSDDPQSIAGGRSPDDSQSVEGERT
ncbi:tRNA methyltransferase 10 homolog B-like [Liolophura sinensis]|uniref:tRNA methyltransferase 10 homolog B-like n=1 Tax=Liolophura sinensis TaxID=3198878 RepID=UPI0031588559